jgi:low affinity Fe/Cu permease
MTQPLSQPLFDRFASRTSTFVSRAPFFAACLLLVLIWLPTLFLLPLDTSQLIINTLTTIITFLLVALLQNSNERFEKSTHLKLNAVLAYLAASSASPPSPDDQSAARQALLHALGSEEEVAA